MDKAGGQTLSHYMKIWADKWPFSAEAKGSVVKPEYDFFIVTSNYSIRQIYGARQPGDSDEDYEARLTAVEAIERRFRVININSRAEQQMWMEKSTEEFPVGRLTKVPALEQAPVARIRMLPAKAAIDKK